jgi:hypothetical protein
MEGVEEDVLAGAHLWRRRQARGFTETTYLLYGAWGAMESRLERAGYHLADMDQWGRCYRHPAYPGRTVEVDELDDRPGVLKVLVREEEQRPRAGPPTGGRQPPPFVGRG